MDYALCVERLSKTFTLHTQGGAVIQVFKDLSLEVFPGECVALHGPSGTGKSTLLKSLYANYKPIGGSISVRHEGRVVDMASAEPRVVLEVRKQTMGYVSQFLRAIPRVPSREIVAHPAMGIGIPREIALTKAEELLARLRIPSRLWSIAPATFSGGEQQRVNIARGFAVDYPILLLDEPTAALDARNRSTVVELINEAKQRGSAVVGIFHDEEVRDRVADRVFDVAANTLPGLA
jgi:alpha-D-ribose 1-methylphosphonate 5-triphosphate synthase subunit PhnL